MKKLDTFLPTTVPIYTLQDWYVNAEMPQDAVQDCIAIDDIEKQKQLLAELLDKNQLYVNLSEIEDADFGVSDDDKDLNEKFYGE